MVCPEPEEKEKITVCKLRIIICLYGNGLSRYWGSGDLKMLVITIDLSV